MIEKKGAHGGSTVKWYTRDWGAMDTDGQAKSTWIDESCDKVVGGKDAINCPGIFFTNITRCKDIKG